MAEQTEDHLLATDVCLDGKAYLVQLEAGFPTERWKDMGTYHLISPNSIMNYGESRIYIPAPAKQGPRPLLRDQGRVGKSDTGSDKTEQMELSMGRRHNGPIQLRKKIRIGTWNIRTLLQLGKLQVLGRELERIGVDICGRTRSIHHN